MELKGEFDNIISSIRAELTADITAQLSNVKEQLRRQHSEHVSSLDLFKSESGEQQAAMKQELQQEISDTRSQGKWLHDASEKDTSEKFARFQSAQDSVLTCVDRLEGDLNNLSTELSSSRAAVEQRFISFKTTAETKLARLDTWNRQMQVVLGEVENVPTRRIEWHLTHAKERLESATQGTTFFSPEFEAGGVHGMQLELRLLGNGENSCEVLLWCCHPALKVVVSLYIGTAHKTLNHDFDQLQSCSTGPLCSWKGHLNSGDDTLSIGVEILEAVREVPLVSRSALCDGGDHDDVISLNFPSRRIEGDIVRHRYLIHRTLDLVQSQVDHIKSRMVRRVEWRIDQASELRRCFPSGECLCSVPFDAGGIENLQLIFYPSGCSNAREGNCSLFVHCPQGTVMHCYLVLGKQRWEACKDAEFARGYFGRRSFCLFDSCIERDDTILAAIELQEVQQDVVWSQQAHRPARQLACGGPRAIESVVSLRRSPAHNTLEDVKQLPPLWTSKLQPDLADGLEDYHSFNDVRLSRRPPTARRIASGSRCRPVSAATAMTSPRCRPTPSLADRSATSPDRYQMYTC
jgi:hypothetical protein